MTQAATNPAPASCLLPGGTDSVRQVWEPAVAAFAAEASCIVQGDSLQAEQCLLQHSWEAPAAERCQPRAIPATPSIPFAGRRPSAGALAKPAKRLFQSSLPSVG